jgi:hypothetical protein
MSSKDFLLENKKENKVVIELAFQPISHYKTFEIFWVISVYRV